MYGMTTVRAGAAAAFGAAFVATARFGAARAIFLTALALVRVFLALAGAFFFAVRFVAMCFCTPLARILRRGRGSWEVRWQLFARGSRLRPAERNRFLGPGQGRGPKPR